MQKNSKAASLKELKAEYVGWRKVVGFVVAHCRNEKGLTQEELGKKIGRSRSWVAKAEVGMRKVEFGDLVVIARKMGIALESMLHRIRALNENSTPE